MDLEIVKELIVGLTLNLAYQPDLNLGSGVVKGRFLNSFEEGFTYFLRDETGGYSIEIPEKTRKTLLLLRKDEAFFYLGLVMGALHKLNNEAIAEKTRVEIPHLGRHFHVKRESLGELCTGKDLFCAFGVAI